MTNGGKEGNGRRARTRGDTSFPPSSRSPKLRAPLSLLRPTFPELRRAGRAHLFSTSHPGLKPWAMIFSRFAANQGTLINSGTPHPQQCSLQPNSEPSTLTLVTSQSLSLFYPPWYHF